MSDLDNNSRYVVHGTAVEGREPTRSTILDQGWTLLGTSTILDQGWTLVSTILDQGWTLWFKEQHTWQGMHGMAPRSRHENHRTGHRLTLPSASILARHSLDFVDLKISRIQ